MLVRKIIFILSFILILCVHNASAKTRTIVVGYSANLGFVKDINSYDKGFGYEIFKSLENYSDLRFEFIAIDPVDLVEDLYNNVIDVYLAHSIDKSYASLFEFGLPLLSVYPVIATKNDEIFYNDPRAIAGKSIAVIDNTMHFLALNNYLKVHNVQANFLFAKDYDEQKTMEADFYLTNSIQEPENTRAFAILEPQPFSFIVKKGNKELLEELNSLLAKYLTERPSLLNNLYTKYFNRKSSYRPSLTKEQTNFIKGKKFKVGFIGNHIPYQFVGNSDEPSGFSVNILNYLAEKYGFEVEYVPYYASDNADKVKEFDFLISILGKYGEISKYYDFTTSYYDASLVQYTNLTEINRRLVKKPNSIGVLEYLGIDYERLEKLYPNTKIIKYYSVNDLLNAFEHIEVDSILITDSATHHVLALIGTSSGGADKFVETTIDYQFRFAISKKISNEYINIFNTMLADIPADFAIELTSIDPMNYIPLADYIEVSVKRYLWQILFCIIALVWYGYYHYNMRQKIKHKDELEFANRDTLTSCYSTNGFNKVVQEKLLEAKPNEYEIISFDINYFQTINDYYGFDVGTKILMSVANVLREQLDQSADIARISGDNFVIFRRVGEELSIKYLCEKYIIPEIKKIIGKSYGLTLAVGMYLIDNPEDSIDSILARANIARQQGKGFHQSTYIRFNDEMKEKHERKNKILIKMKDALQHNEFVIVFQPKVNLQTLKIGGAEALIRWVPKDDDKIFPDEFIPFFERNGFIVKLDFYIFKYVCEFIKKYKGKVNLPKISCNLSGISLTDPRTKVVLLDILQRNNLTADDIEIEVTESAVVKDTSLYAEKIQGLKDAGFTVAMDDFGSGISSLNRLSTMNVDIIKMDKEFLQDNLTEKSAVVLEETIKMANKLNMKVVAEGVENGHQAFWLKTIGCEIVQGYYFDKALSEEEFLNVVKEEKQYNITCEAGICTTCEMGFAVGEALFCNTARKRRESIEEEVFIASLQARSY